MVSLVILVLIVGTGTILVVILEVLEFIPIIPKYQKGSERGGLEGQNRVVGGPISHVVRIISSLHTHNVLVVLEM